MTLPEKVANRTKVLPDLMNPLVVFTSLYYKLVYSPFCCDKILIKWLASLSAFSYNCQAEKFGDSFVLEGKISKEIKKGIHQAVSDNIYVLSLHYFRMIIN